jgi:hypothetical protein
MDENHISLTVGENNAKLKLTASYDFRLTTVNNRGTVST